MERRAEHPQREAREQDPPSLLCKHWMFWWFSFVAQSARRTVFVSQTAATKPLSSVSLVIAAYNEAETLRLVFERSLSVLQQCVADFEVIILDDASTDETPAIAADIQRQHPDVVQVITHPRNRGIAVTFEDLYQAASKAYVFDVPADGEYPPEALLDMIPLLPEHDVIICNRVKKNYTLYRRVVSRCYRWMPRLLFGVDLYDPGSTKCRRQALITDIQCTSHGVFVEAERMIRAAKRGYRITKVDIVPDRRLAGDPRGARLSNVLQAALDLVTLWVRFTILRQRP